MRSCGRAVAAALIALAMGGVLRAQTTGAAAAYRRLLQREAAVRVDLGGAPASTAPANLLKRMREVTAEYEQLSKTYRTSGYGDNALWQGAVLAGDTFIRFGYSADRRTARRMLSDLAARFPSSSLVSGIAPYRDQLNRAAGPSARPPATTRAGTAGTASSPAPKSPSPAPAATATGGTTANNATPRTTPTRTAPAAATTTAAATGTTTATTATTATTRVAAAPPLSNTLTELRREVLPDAIRLTLLLDRETTFTTERIDGASRVHIDLPQTQIAQALKDARLTHPDGIVRQVQVANQRAGARVMLELERGARFSIYPMYGPYRLIVDVERAAPVRPAATPPAVASTGTGAPPPPAADRLPTTSPRVAAAPATPPSPSKTADTTRPMPPAASRSGYSLSRQLGLGAARIVIDPGHGGHDPGAQSRGMDEASLVLDIALRLEQLLLDTPGVEVLLTRRTSEYVPLEERTAMANRADADLFLSIHANASPNSAARGIETYFLNFAPNAEAEAIAARENAASIRTMRNLNDMVKAIAFNDKVDESRDFAMRVQASLYGQLRKVNNQARSLGVKQAPFQVLIGATMPSILAEISFITNEREAQLLKTDKYRQQIAAALFDGIMGYQRSLKTVKVVSGKPAR